MTCFDVHRFREFVTLLLKETKSSGARDCAVPDFVKKMTLSIWIGDCHNFGLIGPRLSFA